VLGRLAGRQQAEVVDHVRLAHRDHGVELGRGGIEGVDLQLAAHLARVGEVGQGAVTEVIDDVDRVVLGEEPFGEVGADEAGTTHHERLHVASGSGRRSACTCSPAATTPSAPITLSFTVARAPT
jgi:hypothetical protein